MFLITAVALGFLGSFHCVAMCGPIALAIPLDRKNLRSEVTGILSYNGGRILTYSLLGSLFGLVGHSFVLAGYQRSLSIVLGLSLLASVIIPKTAFSRLQFKGGLFLMIARRKADVGKLFRRTGFSSLFLIGTLNGLLPCGFVYAGLAGSLLSGGILKGALFMALFGLGTLPAMAALSFAGNKLSAGFRVFIRRVLPVLVLFMGVLLILRGLNLGLPFISPDLSSPDWSQHTCCHKK